MVREIELSYKPTHIKDRGAKVTILVRPTSDKLLIFRVSHPDLYHGWSPLNTAKLLLRGSWQIAVAYREGDRYVRRPDTESQISEIISHKPRYGAAIDGKRLYARKHGERQPGYSYLTE